MLTSTGAVDWASYLSWSQADMSAGERARSNVLVMKDRAHEIDREIAIRHILAKDELAGAWILFQDLPCIGGNAEPLGREAYVLAHDCLTMDFRLIWLETLPDSMEEICSALKTGKEVARIGLQDFCDVFEGRSHIDESRSTWAPEKGFQICVWISIATFVLDFHEAFVPDRQSIWTWHKLMREWRQKLEKVEAVEETIDLDSMDIGEQDLTDLPVEDEPFTFMSTKVFKQAELEPIDEMYESEVETIFSPRNSTSTQSSELEEAGIWSCILQSSSKTTRTEYVFALGRVSQSWISLTCIGAWILQIMVRPIRAPLQRLHRTWATSLYAQLIHSTTRSANPRQRAIGGYLQMKSRSGRIPGRRSRR